MKAVLRTLLSTVLVVATAISTVVQAEPARGTYSTIDLISEVSSVKPGKDFTLALLVTPDPSWHNYWVNPGEAGKAMKVRWKDLPTGVEVGEFTYETPHLASMAGIVTYGYDAMNAITMKVSVPADYSGGDITLGGKASYLVCDDANCVPQSVPVSITLPIGGGDIDPANVDAFKSARNHQPENVNWKAAFYPNADLSRVRFEVSFPEQGASDIYLWPSVQKMVEHTMTQETQVSNGVLSADMTAGKRLKRYEQIDLLVTYKDANGNKQAKFISGVSKNGVETSESNAAAAPASGSDSGSGGSGGTPAAAEQLAVSAPAAQGGEASISFLWALVLAFGGGLILNLMPCVLPVLSLKMLSLAKMGDSHPREVRSSGVFYTVGVLVSFLIMASIVIAIKAAGEAVAWGFQLTNPIFVLSMVLLMVLIGMNLLGAFEFGTSMMNVGSNLTDEGETHSKKSSFWTGVLAVVVATPCTAPMMAPALGYAFTLPWYGALVIFMGLGFGLAFPYLLIAFVPNARRIVPNPGPWMSVFKTVLAFPMFGTAAWLIWVLGGTDAMVWAIAASLAIALAAWAWGKIPMATSPNAWRVTAVLALAVVVGFGSLAMDRKELAVSQQENAKQMRQGVSDLIAIIEDAGLELDTEQRTKVQLALATTGGEAPYTEEALMKSLANGERVFAYFTADWCVSCKANEKTALHKEATQKFFAEEGIKVFIGDDTNGDPEIAKILELYNQPGVPLYLYFEPGDSLTGAHRLPQLLPSPSTIIDGIKNSRG
ncbi:cytochrome c biogenesis protein CcdA [Porticoccus sp. GXU_MW_L64]